MVLVGYCLSLRGKIIYLQCDLSIDGTMSFLDAAVYDPIEFDNLLSDFNFLVPHYQCIHFTRFTRRNVFGEHRFGEH